MGVNYHGKKFYNIGTRGQCYKTNTVVIYCHFMLNYRSNFYNIEFTLEWQNITSARP